MKYRIPLALALLVAVPVLVQAQVLQRHVAEFRFGAEQSTTMTAAAFPGPPDGTPIYQRAFFLPPGQQTVFITLSTTGDAHSGAAHWFSARLNDVPCNLGNQGAGIAPNGWIPLQKHFGYENVTYTNSGVPNQSGGDGGGGNGDMHDNGIYYTWCCVDNVLPGANNRAEIKMASSAAGVIVFVERSHYYIDSVNLRLCNPAGVVVTNPEEFPTGSNPEVEGPGSGNVPTDPGAGGQGGRPGNN